MRAHINCSTLAVNSAEELPIRTLAEFCPGVVPTAHLSKVDFTTCIDSPKLCPEPINGIATPSLTSLVAFSLPTTPEWPEPIGHRIRTYIHPYVQKNHT